MILRAPWAAVPQLLAASEALVELRRSLVCVTVATAIGLVLGVPLAWVLARSRSAWIRPLRALVTLPLVPHVVGGVALLLALGRRAVLRSGSGRVRVTITFAGNLPGVTQTMPLAVYRAFETDPPAAVALTLVLLAVSVAVLVLLRDRWLRSGPGLRAGLGRVSRA